LHHRKWRTFLKAESQFKLLFLPALLLVVFARITLLLVPFRVLASRLGEHAGIEVWIPVLNSRQIAQSRHIGQAVSTAARYTPWESNCFPQAIAARWLLGLHGIPYTLCLGMKRDEKTSELLAHAWVAAGPVFVTGGDGFSQYSLVGSFVARKALPR